MVSKFVLVSGRRQSHHVFHIASGHYYYNNRSRRAHECMFNCIAKHFTSFRFFTKKCEVTLESGEEHLHEPFPRIIFSHIVLLWSAQLECFDWPGLFNGSTGLRVALSKWGRVPDVTPADVERFYKSHKGLLFEFAKNCIDKDPWIYTFHNVLGPERLTIARDFLFSATPSYWVDGPPAQLPSIFGAIIIQFLGRPVTLTVHLFSLLHTQMINCFSLAGL